MSETIYLTREDAAAACGRSVDTIRRHERAGKLLGVRTGKGGRKEIPVSDLVACGLLDPLAAGSDVVVQAGRGRAERDLADARTELAVLGAQLTSANERIADLRNQVEFLQGLVSRSAA